jgi:hypothetical protein
MRSVFVCRSWDLVVEAYEERFEVVREETSFRELRLEGRLAATR